MPIRPAARFCRRVPRSPPRSGLPFPSLGMSAAPGMTPGSHEVPHESATLQLRAEPARPRRRPRHRRMGWPSPGVSRTASAGALESNALVPRPSGAAPSLQHLPTPWRRLTWSSAVSPDRMPGARRLAAHRCAGGGPRTDLRGDEHRGPKVSTSWAVGREDRLEPPTRR
jgi:hypothetical protein